MFTKNVQDIYCVNEEKKTYTPFIITAEFQNETCIPNFGPVESRIICRQSSTTATHHPLSPPGLCKRGAPNCIIKRVTHAKTALTPFHHVEPLCARFPCKNSTYTEVNTIYCFACTLRLIVIGGQVVLNGSAVLRSEIVIEIFFRSYFSKFF